MIRTWEGEVVKVEDKPAVDIKSMIKNSIKEV
jgi:lysine 2,3-aminomutase